MKERNILQLGDKAVSYTVNESSDSKHVSLRLKPDLRLEVTVPSSSHVDVEAVLKKKRKWIERKYEDVLNSKRIFDGNRVLYRGEYRNIDGSTETPRRWLEDETTKLVRERLAEFQKRLKFLYNSFLIRDIKKWGRCTRDGRLIFSGLLAALPRDLADYVILHELAHLREFNHSRRFKYLLASISPDYKEKEAMLKRFIG